ncbi:MAG TPA: aminopeptidase P family N-terminal domain-containing protein, partial [Rhizomicrobium sp.]|nr:aminopeptidase P family N-terminal domain-containing protein [Rhizomicrobium sp.]
MDKTTQFQTYDDVSDAATCAPRLKALRDELARRGLDGFVIPHSDDHQNEYLPANAERLAWLTSFTGSACTAVVLKDKAAIFVDGRYTLQVKKQTDTALFEPRDLVAEGPQGWLPDHLPAGAKLAYDPWLTTANGVALLRQAAEKAGGSIVACSSNPLDAVWTDRPAAPKGNAVPHPFNLSGEDGKAKRTRVAATLKKAKADAAVITLCDSVCWLFNIRGTDIPHTPFVVAFAILHADGSAELFLDGEKRSPDLAAHLGDGVQLKPASEFTAALDALKGKSVLADPATAASAIFDRLDHAGAKVIRGPDPCQLPKACKNPLEIEGTRKAHIRDGAALSRFLCWFAREAPNGALTEIAAAEALEGFRRATNYLSDLSFDSISGAGSNGAIVHYRVTRSTNRAIASNEMFLIDSGAQYPDGTTDVTRTVIVG